jgi:hypothetical protein
MQWPTTIPWSMTPASPPNTSSWSPMSMCAHQVFDRILMGYRTILHWYFFFYQQFSFMAIESVYARMYYISFTFHCHSGLQEWDRRGHKKGTEMADIWGVRDEPECVLKHELWFCPLTQCECVANQFELDRLISVTLILGALIINFAYNLIHRNLLLDSSALQHIMSALEI